MKELHDAGCEIKLYRPPHGDYGWERLHTKTWLLDERLILTGSVNLTDCGMHGNKEHMFVIRESATVKRCLEDFKKTWGKATPLKSFSGYRETLHGSSGCRSPCHERCLAIKTPNPKWPVARVAI